MGAVDIAVLVIVSAAVLGVIGWFVYRKVKHKSAGCDCGCGSCEGCSACKQNAKDDK